MNLFQGNPVSRIKNKFESSNCVANQKLHLPVNSIINQITRRWDISICLLQTSGSEAGGIEGNYIAFKDLI